MKPYTKNYLDFFGLTTADFIPCEICGTKAVDIHHIRARGMGGTKERFINQVENLMALCRDCHEYYGDKAQHRGFLTEVHRKKLLESKHDNETIVYFDHKKP
jgi:5-methylcytosine-specific restriction endonuclease McrA